MTTKQFKKEIRKQEKQYNFAVLMFMINNQNRYTKTETLAKDAVEFANIYMVTINQS